MELQKFPCNIDKSPACQHWQQYIINEKELALAPLHGVVIPKNVLIIDIDSYKANSSTINDIDELLGIKLDWESAALQKTQRGGMHYAFYVDDEASALARPGKAKSLNFVDIKTSFKSYICTNNPEQSHLYEDVSIFGLEFTLTNAADVLPHLSAESVRKLCNSNLDNIETTDLLTVINNAKLGLTLDEIKGYVDRLTLEHSEDHDTWFQVMCAIHHETDGSEEGWQIFDEFSKKALEKYNYKQNKARWQSLNKTPQGNPITFATVINLTGALKKSKDLQLVSYDSVDDDLLSTIESATTENDYFNVLRTLSELTLSAVVEEQLLKKIQVKCIEIFGTKLTLKAIRSDLKKQKNPGRTGNYYKDFVFVTTDEEFCNVHTKSGMSTRAFNQAFAQFTPLSKDGMNVPASEFCTDKIEVVNEKMYLPSCDTLFEYDNIKYLNTFIPKNIFGSNTDTHNIVDKIQFHISNLIESEREQEIFTNFLAHNIQFPGDKIHWAILLQGVEGCGKSFFYELMQHLLGVKNVRSLNAQVLEGNFTGWAAGQCVTFIEEVKLDNHKKYAILNNLKPYISNDSICLERKGVDAQTVVNTTNYIILTNFVDALPISENDRRYCVIFSRWQNKLQLAKFLKQYKEEHEIDYFTELFDLMRKNPKPIHNWLKTHKIPKWFTNSSIAPDTDAKNKMIALSKSDDQISIEDAIYNNECAEINSNIVYLEKLIETIRFDPDANLDIPKKTIKNILLNLGYSYIGRHQPRQNKKRNSYNIYHKNPIFKISDLA